MDSNKLNKLKDIKYRIQDCCGTCVYANLSPDGWGTCMKHIYKHQKHSGEERQVSIHQYGVCVDFKLVDDSAYESLKKLESYLDED